MKKLNEYLYHYSSMRFNVIKTLSMLSHDIKDVYRGHDKNNYKQHVSLFWDRLTNDDIKAFRYKGFHTYGTDEFYEYKVSLADNRDKFIEPLELLAIPENEQFLKSEWGPFLKGKGLDLDLLMEESDIGDKYWHENQGKYNKLYILHYDKLMKKFITHIYGELTVDNFITSKVIYKHRTNWNEFVHKTLVEGEVSKFASYIPHVYTMINSPLVPCEITQII